MKIVLIHGQNHKGTTYHIGRSIADKIEGENEITEFFLPKDLEHFCLGCYKCIEDVAACPFYSGKKVMIDAIDAADILIFTTPTYCLHVSAPLKAFIDLTFDMWMVHRPLESMFSKKAVIVSASAGSSTKSAMKDVQDALFYWGVPKIIKYGLPVQASNWQGVSDEKKAAIDKATGVIAKKLSSGKKPSVGIKTSFMFGIMGMMHKKGWNSSPVETEYWKEKGWLDGKKPWK
ncbi:MAG: NAD(P)H-dependent oxidoreductase [Ruminiclostridium sp.]|nr:NAD(P)H-dependent oxidoreductase [Ruminiclostridium sp.]